MTISEEIFKIDPRAYVILRKFDERVDDYIKNHRYSSNKENKNLKETLISCIDIIKILDGFENPPKEIIEELTDEGQQAIFKHYHKRKMELLSKCYENIILSYEAIRVGHELANKVLLIKQKTNRIARLARNLRDFFKAYKEIIELKEEARYILLRDTKISAKERKYLFTEFEKELNSTVLTKLISEFSSRVTNHYKKDIKQFCEEHKIKKDTNNLTLEQKINLSKILHDTHTQYRQLAVKYLNNDASITLESIDALNLELETLYETKGLEESECLAIYNFAAKVESEFIGNEREEEILSISNKLKNNYTGILKDEIDIFIDTCANNAISGRSITQKFRDILLTFKEN